MIDPMDYCVPSTNRASSVGTIFSVEAMRDFRFEIDDQPQGALDFVPATQDEALPFVGVVQGLERRGFPVIADFITSLGALAAKKDARNFTLVSATQPELVSVEPVRSTYPRPHLLFSVTIDGKIAQRAPYNSYPGHRHSPGHETTVIGQVFCVNNASSKTALRPRYGIETGWKVGFAVGRRIDFSFIHSEETTV